MQKQSKIRILVECAVMIALASVLSVVVIWEAPLGGSVTLFSMVPIILLSFRHGLKWGIGSAFVYSVIQLLLGMKNVMWVPTAGGIVLCILFDYIIAFSGLGLAGVFNNAKLNNAVKVIAGTLFVCIFRYACHVFIGAVVWYSLTLEGSWNDYVATVGMWTYSLVYNIMYMGPETAITLLATPIILMVMARLSKKTA